MEDVAKQRFRHIVGIWVLQQRTKKGWSQNQLQERTGIDRGFIANIETGAKPLSLPRFVQLCKHFEPEAAAALVEMIPMEVLQ